MRLRSQEGNQTSDELLLKQVRYKSFAKLILMVLNICLSPFYFGYAISYLGTFQFNTIVKIFGITMNKDIANGLLQGCIPIGGGIGALSSFLLLKYFSRRNSFLAVNIVALIVTAGSLTTNQFMLFAVRFLQGICVGFYSALGPLMIKQLAPTQISGSLGALNQFFIAFGVFFSNLLQLILNQFSQQEDHWQYIYGFPLITVIIQTILFIFVYPYQTPKYLLENDRQEDCIKILQAIYKQQFVQEVLNQKKDDLGINNQKKGSQTIIQSTLSNKTDQNKSKPKKSLLRLIVAIHLAVLQQFVGINAVVAYGPAIAIQVLPNLKNVIPVILNLQQTLASLSTSYLLSKFGRKTLLQIGTIVFVISLVIISVGFIVKNSHDTVGNIFVVLGLVIFMAMFGLTLGPVVWLLIPEIIEAQRVSIAVGTNWGSAALVMILFPIINSAVGVQWPCFLFFAVYCLISFFVSQKYLIETKGKEQKQIYEQFDKLTK